MKPHSAISVFAVGALLVAFGIVACDDDDDLLDDGTPSLGDQTASATVETTVPSGSQGGSGGETIVEISADAPGETIAISAGESVTFVNNMDERVSVTINGEEESGELESGDRFEFTFDEPGEYVITVDADPAFFATITVT